MRSAADLTSAEAWDWHWRRLRLPQLPRSFNPNVWFARRLLSGALRIRPGRAFEVGCAPGAWLAYFARSLGVEVAGCDLSAEGVRATRENLALLGVSGRVLHGDVFRLGDLGEEGMARFDLVYSIGVVEHFDELDAILGAHARLCAPGGHVVVTAPKLTGPSGAIFRAASPSLMRTHRVVTPEALRESAQRVGLVPLETGTGGPLAAFVWLDRMRPGVRRRLAYAACLLLALVTYPFRNPALCGSVFLTARRKG